MNHSEAADQYDLISKQLAAGARKAKLATKKAAAGLNTEAENAAITVCIYVVQARMCVFKKERT